MRRSKGFLPAIIAAIGLASLAGAQFIINSNGSGLSYHDPNARNSALISQLWNHAQALEREALEQRKSIAELDRRLTEEQEKYKKLERRVRDMELRGK